MRAFLRPLGPRYLDRKQELGNMDGVLSYLRAILARNTVLHLLHFALF